jgi:uncharacterized protein YlxW (UPF0749 family)
MAADINALLDSALEKADAVSKKQDALVTENTDSQKKIADLQDQVNSLQAQVNAGTLHPDQEKKIQDLVSLLERLLK